MRPRDRPEALRIEAALAAADLALDMPGIASPSRRNVLIEQLVESQRRNTYIRALRERPLTNGGALSRTTFDPLMESIVQARKGNIEEAFWLVFLYVHFGKHRTTGWKYAADVYCRLDQGGTWDWPTVAADVNGLRDWLDANRSGIKSPGLPGGFGNHRKYESLAGWRPNGTGEVIASYVDLIQSFGSHVDLFNHACHGATPEVAFDRANALLERVHRFGRMARFDYLMMVHKLDLANVTPGHCYLEGATGPLTAARLLFGPKSTGGKLSAKELRPLVSDLEKSLQVGYDVIEDALCNWQKSPSVFKPFRG